MLTQLALATHIPWESWADAPPEVVITALQILEDQAREQRRAQARRMRVG